jgi:hypothetical protein
VRHQSKVSDTDGGQDLLSDCSLGMLITRIKGGTNGHRVPRLKHMSTVGRIPADKSDLAGPISYLQGDDHLQCHVGPTLVSALIDSSETGAPMILKSVAGCCFLIAMSFSQNASAQVEVRGTADSQATDLSANPNAVDDNHTFDNTTPALAITPTTANSSAAMPHGTASGTVTLSEGLFQGLATSSYAKTSLAEASQTDVRGSATDLATISSATLPMNTPVTLNFVLSTSGTLTTSFAPGSSDFAFAGLGFNISQQFFPANVLRLSYNSSSGSKNSLSGSFAGFVGEQLILSQSTELETYTSGNQSPGDPATVTVDFTHGVQFYADSATAGATLVANSGHNYSTPSPLTLGRAVGVDSPIPGGAGNFTSFQSPTYQAVAPQSAIGGGNIAFVGAGTGGQQGVYLHATYPTPPPIKIADLNTAIPGGTGNFTSFFTQVGAGGGNVVFIGSGASGQMGIYAMPTPPPIYPGPPPIKIADLNTAIPAGTGNFTGFALAAPATSGGSVAFMASGSAGQQGVYLQGAQPSPPPIKIADMNTAIPGGTGNFTGFVGSPAMSGQNVAFIGSGTGAQQGVYLSGGSPSPPPIKVADTQTTMPGTTANFQFFSSESMDSSVAGSALAFVGGGTTDSGPLKGVYFEGASPTPPPIKVADSATLIPGGTGMFIDFGNVAFDPDSTGNHITAFLGVGAGGQEGIYADVADTLTKVVDLHDTLNGQALLSLNLGTGGLDSGVLTFAATLADGTQGLFTDNLALPGDYNHNGVVDAADYVVWRNGLGTTYTQADYDVWRAHFGQPAGSGAVVGANFAVPEPGTLLQIILMAAVVPISRRRSV